MGISSRRMLEITIISGKNVNVTEDAYIVIRGESLNCCTTRMVSDSGCGNDNSSFLSWNEKFLLDVPLHARSIMFEVQCKKFKGARPVGVARIAVSDFLGGDVPKNCMQVLSYRLRDWEGRQNGVIHFAVKVATPEECSNVAKKEIVASVKNSDDQFTGIHVGDKIELWSCYQCSILVELP